MDASLIEGTPPKTRVSPQRWWVLLVASAFAGTQGGIWVIYGVVAQAVKPLYGWSDATIFLLSFWGPATFLLAAYPTSWVLDRMGMRSAAILGTGITFAGSVARCLTHSTDETGAMLAHLGQILNGFGGPCARAPRGSSRAVPRPRAPCARP